jgi:hypothetical protein
VVVEQEAVVVVVVGPFIVVMTRPVASP